MKLRSLRWRIQLWYGLLLAIVLVGFDAFVYLRLRDQEFRRVDAELESSVYSLVNVLRGLPPFELERGLLGDHRPPPRDEFGPGPRRDDREPWDGPPGDPLRPPPPWLRSLVLSPGFTESNKDVPHFFLVWQEGTGVIAGSPQAPLFSELGIPASFPAAAPSLYSNREMRYAAQCGPASTYVVVARSIERELGQLNLWLLRLSGVSLVIFLAGIAGGAWLSKQALQPLEDMSDTAASISAENLSQRIDVSQTDLELTRLAETLNGAFSRLEQAFQRQAAFTADASHELRTPLTTLLGRLELLQMQRESAAGVPSANIDEEIRICLRAARRMKSLVQQLLLLARADAGKLPLDPQAFDLAPVVEECVELLTPLAADKQIEFRTELEPTEVIGDPQLLAQVVINLVTTAIAHNRPQGWVRIELRTTSAECVLQVADNGPGIPLDSQAHVFERFFRADESRSRDAGGNGLGLAISQSIVRAHDGEISFQSSAGKGATFQVTLPRSFSSTRSVEPL